MCGWHTICKCIYIHQHLRLFSREGTVSCHSRCGMGPQDCSLIFRSTLHDKHARGPCPLKFDLIEIKYCGIWRCFVPNSRYFKFFKRILYDKLYVIYVNFRFLTSLPLLHVHVSRNKLYRKEIKDKHKIAIEKWETRFVVVYPTPFHIQCNLVNICTYKSNVCDKYVVLM